MPQDMTIEEYLAAGGILSAPENVPPRYRAELMKLMATFVDSELAGAAGFADIINQAPGIKERIAAARIVLEKTDHAEKVLRIMGEFGANTARYVTHHPWTTRLPREAGVGAKRSEHDMRLAVFNYPLGGWDDAVVMNLLMGRAVELQLTEFRSVSYQPLAEAFRQIAPREAHHAELAEEGIAALLADHSHRETIQDSVNYWWPRVLTSFGHDISEKFAMLKALGLRRTPNENLRIRWQAEMGETLARYGLTAPET